MANLLKNAGFENGLNQTYANWKGWYVHPGEGAVCVYQKKTASPRTGFYQDIPKDRFKSNGNYKFQMKLLSPTANANVTLSVWVYTKGQKPQATQKKFNLKVGKWQVVQVNANVVKRNLKKVRAELYWGPTNCELVIQRTYFGK